MLVNRGKNERYATSKQVGGAPPGALRELARHIAAIFDNHRRLRACAASQICSSEISAAAHVGSCANGRANNEDVCPMREKENDNAISK